MKKILIVLAIIASQLPSGKNAQAFDCLARFTNEIQYLDKQEIPTSRERVEIFTNKLSSRLKLRDDSEKEYLTSKKIFDIYNTEFEANQATVSKMSEELALLRKLASSSKAWANLNLEISKQIESVLSDFVGGNQEAINQRLSELSRTPNTVESRVLREIADSNQVQLMVQVFDQLRPDSATSNQLAETVFQLINQFVVGRVSSLEYHESHLSDIKSNLEKARVAFNITKAEFWSQYNSFIEEQNKLLIYQNQYDDNKVRRSKLDVFLNCCSDSRFSEFHYSPDRYESNVWSSARGGCR